LIRKSLFEMMPCCSPSVSQSRKALLKAFKWI
jgi:hypothetical protein